ncbi:MAG: hypothetical protein IJT25_00400 [Clostridia bacterium]|nr:hypothetical protein [Clostridia bacterium]
MKKFNKPSELTKKLIAFGLAGAITVAGLTACNSQTHSNESSSKNATIETTYNGKTPVVQENGLDKIALLVKTMINETYASNFDYYVKSVTITGINVKRAENQIDYAPGVFADYEEPTDAIIDISYVAESVNKQSGEEKVVSNDISYNVSSEKATEVADQGIDNMKIEDVADAIVESTEDKIAMEEITGTNENDNIAGTQLSAKEQIAEAFNERFLDGCLAEQTYSNYTANGYTLTTMVKDSRILDTDASVIFGAAGGPGGFNRTIASHTPYGIVSLVKDTEGYRVVFTTRIITKAEKEGNADYIISKVRTNYTLNEEQYIRLYTMVNEYTNGYLDSVLATLPEGEADRKYSTGDLSCGAKCLTPQVYKLLADIVRNNSLSEDISYQGIDIFDYKDLTNTEKMAFSALSVENNPLIVVTEPNNSLEK